MKQIKIWKLVVLSIVTLGIYPWFWMANRKNELVKIYDVKIPSFAWFIASLTVYVVGAAGWSMSMSYLRFGEAWPLLAFLIWPALFIGSAGLLWWAWHFNKAVHKHITPEISAKRLTVWYFFAGFPWFVAMQVIFNRVGDKKTKVQVSRRFMTVMNVLLAISILFGLWGYYNSVQTTRRLDHGQSLAETANNLRDEYEVCTDNLSAQFPKPTAKNLAEYKQSVANCKDIKTEHNAAVDTYNEWAGVKQ